MRRARALSACVTGALITSAVVSGCSSSPASSTPATSPATSTGSPAASASSAETTITIGLPNSSPSFANSDIAVAQAEGFFKQEGLVVNVDNLSSDVPVVQGVVGGSLQIGASSIEPVVNAAAAGASLKVIGSYADKLTVSLVTSNSITAPAQLRGKRLGIQAVGAFREIMTRMVLESAGLTTSDVTYVPSSSSAYVSELLAGEIQSGVLQEEQALKALNKDKGLHVLVNFEKAFPDYFYGAYVVNASWLASNQVTAGKFLAAITLAHRFMYDNQAAAVAVIAQNTGYPAATVKKAYQVLLTQEQAVPVNSGLSATRLAATIATMKQYKTLTGPAPTATSLLDTTVIDGVLARLGTLGKPLED